MTTQPNVRIAGRLARRSEAFGRSPWTFIDQFLSLHPDLIYFGNGAPAPELYPIDMLREGSARAWTQIDASGLDYGELQGYLPLRQYVCERMARQNIDVAPANVLITFGSQQGIDIAARLMLDPGDVLVGEGPTYIGALQAFDAYEPEYHLFPVDAEGMDVDRLLAWTNQTGQAPKIIYVIPNYQNPTGQTMSLARRKQLVKFADEHGSLIVEDDPYGDFWYDQPSLPAIRSLSDRVAYLGTFSKTIAPGLRVGWMTLPDDLMGLALMAKESSEVCGVRPITRSVHEAAVAFLDGHVSAGRSFYKGRRDAVLNTLERTMPDNVTWTRPGGGFFIWITLPDGMTASELLPIAASNGVGFLPGRFFYPESGGDDRSLRISYSSMPEARLTTGVERLAEAIKQFGQHPATAVKVSNGRS